MRSALALLLAIAFLPWSATVNGQEAGGGVYIAVGDSIPAGIGSSLPRTRSYPAVLRDWMATMTDEPVILDNLTVPGESAATFLAGSQSEALRAAVERANRSGLPVVAVTVTLGGNEILQERESSAEERQAALDAFADSYGPALDEVRNVVGSDVPILVSTVYDPTGTPAGVELTDGWWIARFNDVILEAARERDLIIVDVAAAIGSDAASLTRFPADVHPTNEGHRFIAREFWRALAWDDIPPHIAILSPAEVSRPTPTLRFSVSEPIDHREVVVTIDAGLAHSPVPLGDGEFVVLLDLGQASSADVEISVVDPAGNEATERQTVTLIHPDR